MTGPTGADGGTGPQGIQGEHGIQGPVGPAGEVTLAQSNTKQDKLTAGNNITITDKNNVISSTGGGGTLPEDATFNSVTASTITTTDALNVSGIILAPNQISFRALKY